MNMSLVHTEVITDIRKQASLYDAFGNIFWSLIYGMAQFGKELFFVLTYRCVTCGKNLEEHRAEGLECSACVNQL